MPNSPLIPEDAPGWAIRLEAKLDIAIVSHGQAIESLNREISDLRRERERDVARAEKTFTALDERTDVLERSSFVTTKSMLAAISGTVGMCVGVLAVINSLTALF